MLVITATSGLIFIFISWKLLNSNTTISSGIISSILVNNGVPILPPKNVFLPPATNISLINVVVVVLPSLPVTPITLQGASSTTISTSVVTIAPRSSSLASSGTVGRQLGERKIISNPTNFSKYLAPNEKLIP